MFIKIIDTGANFSFQIVTSKRSTAQVLCESDSYVTRAACLRDVRKIAEAKKWELLYSK